MSPTIASLLSSTGLGLDSSAFAAHLDSLALNADGERTSTRDLYEIPKRGDMGATEGGELDKEAIYMAGNSLGLLPKEARVLIGQELDVWGSRAVTGHFAHPHSRPWKSIDDNVVPGLARIVGASEEETAVTSTLTSNLHNLFVTFFTPDNNRDDRKGRRKILCEAKAFPSDQYAVQSHLDLHKLGPDCLIAMEPRSGEDTLRTEDILSVIEQQGDEIALVWFSGVQYYTGQVFEMDKITKAGKDKGCIVGWDLAHAVGNVTLKLHEWGVDFAVWCHYKYLNSGPGAVAGMFVHSRHAQQTDRPRLSGWWGHSKTTRFTMPPEFSPIPGAQGYQHSNPPVLSLIPLIATLRTIDQAGGHANLRARSVLLTTYLLELLRGSRHAGSGFRVLTPEREPERGAQLSLAFGGSGDGGRMKRVFARLVAKGVMGDEREPEVIRFAPIPLYSTFEEVRLVALYLDEALDEEEAEQKAKPSS